MSKNNNRIFKFRVWDKRQKCFIAPDSINIESDDLGCLYVYEEPNNYILQQFTGLKDRNGKEIYEGDILSGESKETIYSKLFVRYEAEYGGYSFNYPFDKKNVWKHWIKELSNLKIIGNIFENPKLLDS